MNKEKQINPNKIINFLFYKDGKISKLKSIQNILLIYVVSFLVESYYNSFYNPSVRIFSFKCKDCFLPIGLMGIWAYILAFAISILNLFYTYLQKKFLKKMVKLIEFVVFITILCFYKWIVEKCGNPICFFYPLIFPAVVWAYFLTFRRTRYFSQFFVVLFLIPSSIIITDDWMGAPSYNNCEKDMLKASFSSIKLPSIYFHQNNEVSTRQPNVVLSVDIGKEYKNKILYVPSHYCSIGEKWRLEKNKENNIILCVYKDIESFTISTFGEKRQNLVDLKFTKFNRKRNDLDLILHTTGGEYSCAKKLSTDFIIKHLPYEKYLTSVNNSK